MIQQNLFEGNTDFRVPAVEAEENYQKLKAMVLEDGLEPGTLLSYLAHIYRAEAGRMVVATTTSDTSVVLDMYCFQATRLLINLAVRCSAASEMHFFNPVETELLLRQKAELAELLPEFPIPHSRRNNEMFARGD